MRGRGGKETVPGDHLTTFRRQSVNCGRNNPGLIGKGWRNWQGNGMRKVFLVSKNKSKCTQLLSNKSRIDWESRAAEKQAWKYTKKFADDMYRSLGVCYLFLAAMETSTGTVNTGLMDFNDRLGGGSSYTSKNPKWKTEGIDLDGWNDHNRDYYSRAVDFPEVSTKNLPRTLIHLDRNEFGEPILPNPLFVPNRQAACPWRQALVCAFLSYHYCKFY